MERSEEVESPGVIRKGMEGDAHRQYDDPHESTRISVVIPVYNVAPYLKQCVDSVLGQTWGNLEILLVDDGSTDESGEICDAYLRTYGQRIRVFHREHRGLSAARNAGIEEAKGEWITFVDSDDWLQPWLLEALWCHCRTYHACIAGTAFLNVYENGRSIPNSTKKAVQVMSAGEALGCYLFDDSLTPCACGKLYRAELWQGIRFPEGKLFEDQYTTYRLIERAERVVFDPAPGYNYRKREGSIGHRSFTQQTWDLYDGIQAACSEVLQRYPQLHSSLAAGRIVWEMVFLNMMLRAGKADAGILSGSRTFARAHILDVFRCRELDWIRKGQIALFAYGRGAYPRFYQWYLRWFSESRSRRV